VPSSKYIKNDIERNSGGTIRCAVCHIAAAIRTYIAEQERKTLRARLIAGYQANAAAAELAAEWQPSPLAVAPASM